MMTGAAWTGIIIKYAIINYIISIFPKEDQAYLNFNVLKTLSR